MTRNFFSNKRAQEFAETLRKQGAEHITIWAGLDGFGQMIYTVKWEA